jgi:rhodanese-related sulfurtransferase
MSNKKHQQKANVRKMTPGVYSPAARQAPHPRLWRRQSVQRIRKSALGSPLTLILIGIAVIALVVVVILLVNHQPAQVNSLPDTISVVEAYQKYQAGSFVLDVRTQEEWDEFHAPDTTHIPLDELESRLNELPKDEEIVVICRSGNRSQQGRDTLLENGFTAVTSVEGGLKEWSAAGYPIEARPISFTPTIIRRDTLRPLHPNERKV